MQRVIGFLRKLFRSTSLEVYGPPKPVWPKNPYSPGTRQESEWERGFQLAMDGGWSGDPYKSRGPAFYDGRAAARAFIESGLAAYARKRQIERLQSATKHRAA